MASNRTTPFVLGAIGLGALVFVLLQGRKSAPQGWAKNTPSATPGPAVAPPSGVDCRSASDPCACAEGEARRLLAACFAPRALDVASQAPRCDGTALLGLKAQALAETDKTDEAIALANGVLGRDAQNRDARRAQAIAAIAQKNLPAAERELDKLIAEDQKDVESLFYRTLATRRSGRYNDSRNGFLRVLRMDPRHIDARFNLVTLTLSIGAADEARHHLEELERITPLGDPRLTSAKASVGTVEQGNAPPPVQYGGPGIPPKSP